MPLTLLHPVLLAAGLAPAAPMATAPFDTAQATVAAARVSAVVTNVGSFGFDLSPGLASWSEGFEYPRGSGTHPFFPIGLWVTGQIAGVERASSNEYVSEYRPGPILPGGMSAPYDPAYGVYRVAREDTAGYAAWVAAAPLGAPLDASGEAPLVRGNVSTWTVYNDADSTWQPFPTVEPPLRLEVRQTAWAFNEAGPRGASILFRWEILARGAATIDSAYVALWADPDVGWRVDHAATDSALGLAYNYNPPGTDAVYGDASPAFGLRLLRGARATPAGPDLGATSIAVFVNGTDPSTEVEFARLARGLRVDGAPIVDPTTLAVTRFPFGGDPRTGTGWLDTNVADKKFVIGSGPFTFAPGDTQVIAALLVVGQGPDRLASIDSLYAGALADYDAPAVDPPPPPPAPAPARLEASPNPASGSITLRFASRAGVAWRLDAYDVRGRVVAPVDAGEGTGETIIATWNRPDALPSGVYWILLRQGEERMAHPVVLVRP